MATAVGKTNSHCVSRGIRSPSSGSPTTRWSRIGAVQSIERTDRRIRAWGQIRGAAAFERADYPFLRGGKKTISKVCSYGGPGVLPHIVDVARGEFTSAAVGGGSADGCTWAACRSRALRSWFSARTRWTPSGGRSCSRSRMRPSNSPIRVRCVAISLSARLSSCSAFSARCRHPASAGSGLPSGPAAGRSPAAVAIRLRAWSLW